MIHTAIAQLDTKFPDLTSGSTDDKIARISDYLYMLVEELRFFSHNIGSDNINDNELNDFVKVITEPINVRLEEQDGNIASLSITADGINSRISDVEGNVSTLSLTVSGLNTTVQSHTGQITTLTQTVNGISLTAAGTSGNAYMRLHNGDTNYDVSMSLGVTNGERSSTIALTLGSITLASQTIQFTGEVVFKSDLSTQGSTVINGGNITTGSMSCDRLDGGVINGQTIQGGSFTTEADGISQYGYYYEFAGATVTSGALNFYHAQRQTDTKYDGGTITSRGGVCFDFIGGTEKMRIYTGEKDQTSASSYHPVYPLKLEASGNMSVDAGLDSGNNFIYIGNRTSASAGQILILGSQSNKNTHVYIYPTTAAEGTTRAAWSFRTDGIYYNGVRKVSV